MTRIPASSRRAWLGAGAVLITALTLASPAAAQRELVVAEPVHSLGYLPMYVAMHNGYFADEGLELTVMTTKGGGAHTNAVLTKQAFAFIGGPEHNAFAKAKGAELRAVVNVVNRGNVYLMAKKELEVPEDDYGAFLAGKTIATGYFGGTPNSITRYLMHTWGLEPGSDVTLLETSTSAILAAVRAGRAEVGVISEPMLTQGVEEGIWGEPFYNVPEELGFGLPATASCYTYSTINVRLAPIGRGGARGGRGLRARGHPRSRIHLRRSRGCGGDRQEGVPGDARARPDGDHTPTRSALTPTISGAPTASSCRRPGTPGARSCAASTSWRRTSPSTRSSTCSSSSASSPPSTTDAPPSSGAAGRAPAAPLSLDMENRTMAASASGTSS